MSDTEIKCHYCGGPTKIIARPGETPILAECLNYGNEDNYCKRTTIPITTNCLLCEKEFEWLFDPGWNNSPVCSACWGKNLKEFFESPEMKKAMDDALTEPNLFFEEYKEPKSNSWVGGYITLPFKEELVK